MDLSQMQFYMKKEGYSYARLSELTNIPEDRLKRIFEGKEGFPGYSTAMKLELVLNPSMSPGYFYCVP